jgi:predicted nucleotidyltransferase
MIAHIDLAPAHDALLRALLQHHVPGLAVWAYGSRVRGTARPHSDLDLAVFAPADQWRVVAELREASDESNLPFLLDPHRWDDLPPDLQAQIRECHVVIQEAASG